MWSLSPDDTLIDRSLIGGRSSDPTTIWIDGTPLSAEPDSSLFCTFGKVGYKKTIYVVIEVCFHSHRDYEDC